MKYDECENMNEFSFQEQQKQEMKSIFQEIVFFVLLLFLYILAICDTYGEVNLVCDNYCFLKTNFAVFSEGQKNVEIN